MNEKILIHGNSGSSVELMYNGDIPFIRKTDKSDRLLKQINKQEMYRVMGVNTPLIYSTTKTETGYSVDMEYINGVDIFTFFDHVELGDLKRFSAEIIRFITNSLNNVEYVKFPKGTFLEKLESITGIVEYSEDILNMLESVEDLYIPYGHCHGDLTFGNILIKDSTIYYVDFLDTFFESPLQDIVKIYQDTKYNWSMIKAVNNVNTIRNKIIFDYIGGELSRELSSYMLDSRIISIFQIFNLARIIPYTTDSEVVYYLKQSIEREIKEYYEIDNSNRREIIKI